MHRSTLPAALFFVCLSATGALADEGMWTFDNFPAAAVNQKYNLKIDQKWLDRVRNASVRLSTGCSASVSLNSWTGGFVATVRVTAGSTPVNGWSVGLTLPSGATITNAWNASRGGSSGAVQFGNVSYNGQIPAGGYTEFGFQATGSGAAPTPTCSAT